MIIRYAEIDMMGLLLLIAIPIVLMLPSILTMASATSNTTSIITPESVSNVSSSQLAPILLAPIATSGNNVYVVWSSNDTGHLEISFKASTDNGQTFTDKINLSNTPSLDSIDPQIAASGNHVYISWWEDYGNGTRSPFFRASNDNGHTFQPVLSLPNNDLIPVQDNNINGGY